MTLPWPSSRMIDSTSPAAGVPPMVGEPVAAAPDGPMQKNPYCGLTCAPPMPATQYRNFVVANKMAPNPWYVPSLFRWMTCVPRLALKVIKPQPVPMFTAVGVQAEGTVPVADTPGPCSEN